MSAPAPIAAPAPVVPAAPNDELDELVLTCDSFEYPDAEEERGFESDHHRGFICPISLRPIFEPMVCPTCQQLSCLECANKMPGGTGCTRGGCNFKQVPGGPQLFPCKLLTVKTYLDGLHVCCPSDGCGHIVLRSNLPSHYRFQCLVDCRRACGHKISRAGRADHEALCARKKVPCDAMHLGCAWRDQRAELPSHLLNCPFMKVGPALQQHHAAIDSLTVRVNDLRNGHEAASGQANTLRTDVNVLRDTVVEQSNTIAALTARLQVLEVSHQAQLAAPSKLLQVGAGFDGLPWFMPVVDIGNTIRAEALMFQREVTISSNCFIVGSGHIQNSANVWIRVAGVDVAFNCVENFASKNPWTPLTLMGPLIGHPGSRTLQLYCASRHADVKAQLAGFRIYILNI